MPRFSFSRRGAAAAIVAATMLGGGVIGSVLAAPPTATVAPAQSTATVPDKTETDTPPSASQAKITADQAKAAALARYPGATINAVELEDEDGVVVYGVHLVDTAGKAWDVKVDGTTGQITKADSDEADAPGGEG